MNKWQIILAIGVVIAVTQSNAEVLSVPLSKCASLTEELKAMREAERTLLRQMASNNSSFAMTLDHYADEFSDLSKRSRALNMSHLSSLRKSARSYRGHEQRELNLIERFNAASDDLFARVEACLK